MNFENPKNFQQHHVSTTFSDNRTQTRNLLLSKQLLPIVNTTMCNYKNYPQWIYQFQKRFFNIPCAIYFHVKQIDEEGSWKNTNFYKIRKEKGWKKNRKSSFAFQFFYTFLIFIISSTALVTSMSPPPNYLQSNMPNTSFTCDDKATGGYYADPEAHCQMFHVCVRISEMEIKDFRFLCPKDTVFDQETFICTNWWEIDCERSTRYYSKNDLLKEVGSIPEEENPVYYYDYVDEEEISVPTVTTSPATTPLTPRHRFSLEKSLVQSMPKDVETENLTSYYYRGNNTSAVTIIPFSQSDYSSPPTTTKYIRATTYRSNPSHFILSASKSKQKDKDPSKFGRKIFSTGENSNSGQPVTENPRHKHLFTKDTLEKNDITSVGATATSRTRYERFLGHSSIPKRKSSPKNIRIKLTTENPRTSNINSNPPAKHKEFSNFRFYKTAFGRSYSSDDYLKNYFPSRTSRTNRKRKERPERTASQNTRYSIYG